MGPTVFRRKGRFRMHIRIVSVNFEILDLNNAFDFSKDQRWNLKNLSRGLNPPKPGLNSAPA